MAPLLGMLQDEARTDLERAYAATGLGYLAERDDLPWSSRLSTVAHFRCTTDTLSSPQRSGILDLP